MKNSGLDKKMLDGTIQVLNEYPNVKTATLFGSRAKGVAKASSDIDIALHGDFDELAVERVLCSLDELPTAYTFDVVGYHLIKNSVLKEHIDRIGVTIYEAL
jgi:predicted nucleotidyltransferase